MSESFINIGQTRIKKSNIKIFGVSIKKKGGSGLGGAINSLIEGNGFWKGYLGAHTERYLYVTTYQGDNYKFPESQFDIDASLLELEAI